MSVRLGEVMAALDEAYPPRLAQPWDSVGLVCGDPSEFVDAVVVAVDAIPAVAAEVPEDGLLVAHHPLLLRGVDTVSVDTPKGALVHNMIRTGRALFTAHTNADAASPGVSDALAQALGVEVTGVLSPISDGQALDKWVVFVPRDSAEALQAAMFAAGAGRVGDYSHCSWSVTGTGRFLPLAGATPAIGTVGTVESVVENRLEVVAPAGARSAVLTAVRRAHPYEEPAFDVSPLAPLPGGVGLGRVGVLPAPEPLREFASRVARSVPVTTWGIRTAGDPDAHVSRVAVCGGAGDSLLGEVAAAGVDAYVTADLRHHPADEHRRASAVALVDVAHWASEFPWCAQAAAVLTEHFGESLSVRVSTLRTDPWNVEVT